MEIDDTNRRLLLTVKETAKATALGKSTVYKYIYSGVIPAVHIGTAVRVPVAALEAWIDKELDHASR